LQVTGRCCCGFLRCSFLRFLLGLPLLQLFSQLHHHLLGFLHLLCFSGANLLQLTCQLGGLVLRSLSGAFSLFPRLLRRGSRRLGSFHCSISFSLGSLQLFDFSLELLHLACRNCSFLLGSLGVCQRISQSLAIAFCASLQRPSGCLELRDFLPRGHPQLLDSSLMLLCLCGHVGLKLGSLAQRLLPLCFGSVQGIRLPLSFLLQPLNLRSQR